MHFCVPQVERTSDLTVEGGGAEVKIKHPPQQYTRLMEAGEERERERERHRAKCTEGSFVLTWYISYLTRTILNVKFTSCVEYLCGLCRFMLGYRV